MEIGFPPAFGVPNPKSLLHLSSEASEGSPGEIMFNLYKAPLRQASYLL